MQDPPPPIIVPAPEVSQSPDNGAVRREYSVTIVTPQGACRSSDPDEVVICGRRDDERYRLTPLLPNPTLMDEASDSLSGKVGPVEVGSLRQPDGTRKFGLRIRF